MVTVGGKPSRGSSTKPAILSPLSCLWGRG
jgi:hypothetical protein